MNVFDTSVLARVVAALPSPESFILNTFFRNIQTEDSEEIHFDVDASRPRLAPFVSPLVAGQVVHSKGFTTKTFKPAYVKDKRIFDATRPLKRAIGERIGGNGNAVNRLSVLLASALADQVDMLTRRQEVMAVQALRTGKIIVSGEQYPTAEVDFGRDPLLTQALVGDVRWGESGAAPLQDIERWARLITQKSGTAPDSVIMDPAAWKLFMADAMVQKELDRFRGSATASALTVGEGGRHVGRIGNLNFYTYAGWYEDPETGSDTPYLPDYTVIITGQQLEGTRAYGAIRDEEAGFQALPYFSKSWPDQDPAVRYLLMQSAPLPIPYRVNASFCATVR